MALPQLHGRFSTILAFFILLPGLVVAVDQNQFALPGVMQYLGCATIDSGHFVRDEFDRGFQDPQNRPNSCQRRCAIQLNTRYAFLFNTFCYCSTNPPPASLTYVAAPSDANESLCDRPCPGGNGDGSLCGATGSLAANFYIAPDRPHVSTTSSSTSAPATTSSSSTAASSGSTSSSTPSSSSRIGSSTSTGPSTGSDTALSSSSSTMCPSSSMSQTISVRSTSGSTSLTVLPSTSTLFSSTVGSPGIPSSSTGSTTSNSIPTSPGTSTSGSPIASSPPGSPGTGATESPTFPSTTASSTDTASTSLASLVNTPVVFTVRAIGEPLPQPSGA
ncbi:hypothetical protein CMUS01_14319 [Colletotrichum musicola]|uniref:WSC domain-containing protein n=1 Tax=Colletotrichum musicola TaxID=2175873 RepID=A0A8H6J4Z3_9PEZI|nr:hypothetical protein CMUS01_14319 [Colletotrichum musicola]